MYSGQNISSYSEIAASPSPAYVPYNQEFVMQTEDFPALGGDSSSASANSRSPRSAAAPAPIRYPQPNAQSDRLASNMLSSAPPHLSAPSSSVVSPLLSQSSRGVQMGPTASTPRNFSPHPSNAPATTPRMFEADRYGMMGLLNVIKMTDRDLTMLALGTDLTTLGLNLNSTESLYSTLLSLWSDMPASRHPEFLIPLCYYTPVSPMKPHHIQKFRDDTLIYVFYNMPGDKMQVMAARELYSRQWKYEKGLRLWFTHAPKESQSQRQGARQYVYFDITTWCCRQFQESSVDSLSFLKEDELPSI